MKGIKGPYILLILMGINLNSILGHYRIDCYITEMKNHI